MKIIIVENEIYLAQSIANKLSEYDYEVSIFGSAKDALQSNGDIYLVSTSLPGQNFMKLISKHSNKIIILMVNYINNDTVGEPIKKGASDYIVKPFMIEELLRKIDHHIEFRYLKEQNSFFQEYFQNMMREIDHKNRVDKIEPNIVVKTNYIRLADKFVMDMSKHYRYSIVLISLEDENWNKKISQLGHNNMAYILHLDKLKNTDRDMLFEMLENKKFIIACTSNDIQVPFKTIEINTKNRLFEHNDVLTIDEYVQFIVKKFQYEYPDTELSKKLGISRKSLWEKRKKYDLFKKK